MDDQRVAQEPITIKGDLAQRILDELGQNVYLCYQCVKCTSGCPLSEYFDWQPNQIMRAVQFGQADIAFESETPWLCASCQTCTTRCPQGLDIAGIMDFLTREAQERGYKPKVPTGRLFNEAFMRQVHLWGRAFELGLMAEMKLRTGDIMGDMDLGVRMFAKGKLPFLPQRGHRPRNVKVLPEAKEAIAYYPGCSLHATATEFNVSSMAICEALDIQLIEPDGWVCCGSSAAHRCDPQEATRLPMENMALIEQSGFEEVTMPCAACFNRHKAALYEIRRDENHKAQIDEELGYVYQDHVKVSTLSESILDRAGPEAVVDKVNKRLDGLRVVCYYGCLLTRPPQVTEVANPENPMDLDELMSALGAEVLDWSYKTVCCGASHSLVRPDIVKKLSGNLIIHAQEAGADAIVVACPLCHMNLDARQFQMGLDESMPILYFTQLMALALGLPEKAAAWGKNITDPRPLLREKGLLET